MSADDNGTSATADDNGTHDATATDLATAAARRYYAVVAEQAAEQVHWRAVARALNTGATTDSAVSEMSSGLDPHDIAMEQQIALEAMMEKEPEETAPYRE